MTPTITGSEFKHWLIQFIVDMDGKIPDKEDWREIKSMLDRIPDASLDADTAADAAGYIAQWTENWTQSGDDFGWQESADSNLFDWVFPDTVDTPAVTVSSDTLAKELQFIKDDIGSDG